MKRLIFVFALLLLLCSCGKDSTPAGSSYLLTGDVTEPLVISADKEQIVEITLDGVNMVCGGRALISVTEAKEVVLTLAEGSTNTLTVASAFGEDDKANAAIYAKCDITFTGGGSLVINDPYGHGIEAKDDLYFVSGSYSITSSGHGIEAKDSVQITDGSFEINAQKDGIHAENEEDAEKGCVIIEKGSFNITSVQDGISAAAYMELGDGVFDLKAGDISTLNTQPENMPSTEQLPDMGWMPNKGEIPDMGEIPNMGQRPGRIPGGGKGQGGMRPDMQWDTQTDTNTESAKGIKAGGAININAGVYSVTSEDDCIHSNSDLKVLGGEFILTSGDDAFHSDSNLSFSAGKVEVISSYEALEGESIDVHGGSFILNSSDDGMNAAGGADQSGFGFRGDAFGSSNSYINIAGGDILLNANGDGIDSNGTLSVSGGRVTVLGPLSGGNAPVDWQISGEISGGTLIAVGSSSMAMNFGKAYQGSAFITLDSYVEAGKTLVLTDADGNTILETVIEKSFNCVLISSPKMEENGVYNVIIDGTEHPVTLNGFTYSDKSGGFGGFGGGRGQRI